MPDKEKLNKSSQVEIMVTDQDKQMAKQDTYTSRLMGSYAPYFFAAGFRPTIDANNNVVYTSMSDRFDLGEGRGKMALLPDGNGSFDIVEMKDGQVVQLAGQGEGTRKLKPMEVMDMINKQFAFRYNQIADNYNSGNMAAIK